MSRVGDALLKVTDACRINYAILGNSNPILHAHIVPRYSSEPEEFIHGLPWSYPESIQEGIHFDLDHDRKLIEEIEAKLK